MLGNSRKCGARSRTLVLVMYLIQLSPLFIKMIEQVGKAI